MKYMGSKRRLVKHLLPIMRKWGNQGYVEPFVGGGNMIEGVTGFNCRMGFDVNPLAISALKTIRDRLDILPKCNEDFSEDDYQEVRSDPEHPLHGYVAFALSFGGKEWGGVRRDGKGKRDYIAEAYRNAVKQSERIQGVHLEVEDYRSLETLESDVVYCDIPYRGTTKYADSFDHDVFWQWCRICPGRVFISEYEAPDDFISVFEKEQTSSLTQDTGSKRGVEKLFVHRDLGKLL